VRALILLAACASAPLPVPPSDEDYCARPLMPAEERRLLCAPYPREAVLDGGAP
jgi:hypothetical protein